MANIHREEAMWREGRGPPCGVHKLRNAKENAQENQKPQRQGWIFSKRLQRKPDPADTSILKAQTPKL